MPRFSADQQNRYVADARKRGVSQKKIDTFIAGNSEDYQRLKDIEADEVPKSAAPTPSAPGLSAPPPSPSTPASVAALDSATAAPTAEAPPSMPMFVPQEPAGPGMQMGAKGTLRPGMGMRQPPILNMALAALKRLY